ncbi:MAG: right-handed parallel beta-helix repeat-containing protein [Candidatus Heimdallarchaeota archaeon]|nr:MAG: right-handed parallel beta-helix repeat-containing protein [Candidatus Heimdallarchaeota archaeon]
MVWKLISVGLIVLTITFNFSCEKVSKSQHTFEQVDIHYSDSHIIKKGLTHQEHISNNDNPIFQRHTSFYKPLISNQYKPSSPIIIDENSDFNSLGFNGSGTLNNPFVIEGLNITSRMGYLIEIKNTIDWFIITNNILNGLNESLGGIYLDNVTHGIISKNTIYNNDGYGIFVRYSSNDLTIINNKLYDNAAGIGISRSAYKNQVINNTVFNSIKWSAILISYEAYDNEIINNTLISSNWHGIFLWSSAHNNLIVNNIASNNSHGICIENYCYNNTITSNTFFRNKNWGISVRYSYENKISENFVFNNLQDGITVEGANDNTITNNIVCNNTGSGITLVFDLGNYLPSRNNTIKSNNVSNNGINGISIETSWDQNFIINNTIFKNKQAGIFLFEEANYNSITENVINQNLYGISITNSSSNLITGNIILNSSDFGIIIHSSSSFNIIDQNNFINNDNEISQASDSGSDNTFIKNFWNDWIEPDINSDNFVDEPYSIDGSSDNQDYYPLAFPYPSRIHWFSKPIIKFPNGGETLNGLVNIQWLQSFDSFNHSITYSVYYSFDGGNLWNQIAFNLIENNFMWNTSSNVINESTCLLKIIASCYGILTTEDISDGMFSIVNTENKVEDPNFFPTQIIFAFIFSLCAIAAGYYLINTKFRTPSFIEFFQSDKIEFLKPIYHKLIIGLESIQTAIMSETVVTSLLEEPTMPTSLVTWFPDDYRRELKTKLKGRTILTLIEIAFQYSEDTNLTTLARALDIPTSTLSDELKKLIKLNYLDFHVTPQVLHDGRYRHYIITAKGISFLKILKSALELSIRRAKEKEKFV